MNTRVAAWIAVFVIATPAAAQPVSDHLECFKVKDAQTKAVYTADLDGLVAQTGCTIKVPAPLACVPSSKSNVVPAPPGGGATGTPNMFACYKLKCPKGAVFPGFQLNDQFGSRIVTPSGAKMICAPATTTTTPCLQEFEPRVQDIVGLFMRGLDTSGNFEVPPSCGSPATCCPAGTPVTPCGPLHVELMSAAVVDVVGADRFDLTYGMQLTTVDDIPMTIPTVGECLLHVDTSQGTAPTIQLQFQASLSPDHLRITNAANFTITGLTSDDVAITGSFACQLASFGMDFFIDTITDSFAGFFQDQFQDDLCRFCDSTIAACPVSPVLQ